MTSFSRFSGVLAAAVLVAAPALLFAQQGPDETFEDPVFEQRLEEAMEIPELPVLDVPSLEGEPVRLTLEQVVLTTLAQNLNMQIQLKSRDIAAEEVFGEYGIYDPALFGRVTRRRTDQESTGFSGTSYSDSTTTEAGVEQLTPWGTRLSLTAQDQRLNDHNPPNIQGFSVVDPQYTSSVSLRATQPLLKNFGPLVNNANIRISKRQLEQSNIAFREVVQNQLARVMIAYWNLQFALRNLDVERQALESARELNRQTIRRFEVGAVPRLSVMQTEAQVARRQSNIAARQAELIDAQDQLLTLMNWSDTEWMQGWDHLILPVDLPNYEPSLRFEENEVLDIAKAKRPDLLQDLIDLDIAEINRDVAERQRLPELNVFGGYTFSGLDDGRSDAWGDVRDTQYTGYHFGAEFRYPLFNREARARFAQAKDRVEQTELQLQSRELQILQEVRGALRALRTSLAQIEATTRQVSADIEKLEAERRRLDVGARTIFDVLDFQDDLAESRAAQARALIDYQIALVDIGRATGTLLEVQGIEVDEQEPPGGWDYDFDPSHEPLESGEMIEWMNFVERLSAPDRAVEIPEEEVDLTADEDAAEDASQ